MRTTRRRAASAGGNPTVRQRELGIRLRELRNAVSLTVEQVGERLLCSATKISRMETGSRRASQRDVRDLCRIYGVTDEAQVDELMTLASQAREPGWWNQYDEPKLSPYLGLEQEAAAITVYSMSFVPALLQTSEYARATIQGIDRRVAAAVLNQRVEARMRRQELLERPDPPRYRSLLDEAVLRRHVGGPAVMRPSWTGFSRMRRRQRRPSRLSLSTPTSIPAPTAMLCSSNFEMIHHSGRWCTSKACSPIAILNAQTKSPGTVRRWNICVMPP